MQMLALHANLPPLVGSSAAFSIALQPLQTTPAPSLLSRKPSPVVLTVSWNVRGLQTDASRRPPRLVKDDFRKVVSACARDASGPSDEEAASKQAAAHASDARQPRPRRNYNNGQVLW